MAAIFFYLGNLFQENLLKDACLEMGGTILPGKSSVCAVVEQVSPEMECPDPCSMIAGSWVQPVPGNSDMVQGFILYPDGSARSINMATLVYKAWRTKGDAITFHVESIGNHTRFETEERYRFDMPDRDRLILRSGKFIQEFRRMGSQP